MNKTISKILIYILIASLLFFIHKTWDKQNRINLSAKTRLAMARSDLITWKDSTNDVDRFKNQLILSASLSYAHSLLSLSSFNNNKYLVLSIGGLIQCVVDPLYTAKTIEKTEEISKYLQELTLNPSDEQTAKNLCDITSHIRGKAPFDLK